jgi:outer membrane receptor protein involved in Fe transport
MKYVTFLLSLLCFNILVAQPPGSGRPGGGRPGGAPLELTDNTGAFLGVIIDQQTEEPVLLANILIYTQGSDALLGGTTSNEGGFFVIKDLPYGAYDLVISYLGYEEVRRESLSISADARQTRLGRIMLVPATNQLAEIEVTAERAAVEFGLDRKVFNVERDMASKGGTAEDLLRNIPSVTVDLDGNISLRGSSNIRILINGKPSALTGLDRQGFLQQLSAGNIERIEVLTNPSAKYDPEGMGGIINIITKQQNRQGFNLSTAFTVGTRDKYNGNLNLNYRVGKFNIQGGYSYNNDQRFFRGERFRTTETADTSWIQDQDIYGDRHRLSHTFNAGVEYFVAPRATISVTGNYSDQDGDDTSSRDNRFLTGNMFPLFNSLRSEVGTEVGNTWEVNVDYRQSFRNDGQELILSAQRSFEEEVEEENFFEDAYTPDGALLYTDRQLNPSPEENDIWRFQADYTQPLNDKAVLETGGRVTLRGVYNDNQLFDFDPTLDDFVKLTSFSNIFQYQEDVYAAYGILKSKIGKWDWQAGLRVEQTNTEATLLEPELATFNNDYFSLFPSAFLTYNLNEQEGLQFNYSRRINRPRFGALNPFTDFSDPLNPRQGNPFLLPEFINSFEANYLRSVNKGSLSIGAYLRDITDMITRVNQPDPATGVNVRSFINLASGRNYGLEAIATIRPVDKLQFVINGNAYRTELKGNNQEVELNAAGYQFSGRLTGTYTIGKDWGLQLTSFYRSRGVNPQGEMRALYSVDFGVSKPVLKGKGNISLRATDLFNTRRWSFVNSASGITDDATYQRESRIAYLSFNYSLRQDKRRSNRDRGSREGMDDGGGEF